MKRLRRTLEVLAWATFFSFAVAVLGLRYGLLPQIERYRPEIVARVAATVGQPVKIGRIEAEWLGLRPQINLSDVRIYDAEGREALVLPTGYFPTAASYSSDSGDPWLRLLFAPTFRWFDRIVSRLNVLQHGHIHVYVLYVAATLVVLLLWAGL